MAREGWSLMAPRNLSFHRVMRIIGVREITVVNPGHAQVVSKSRDGEDSNCQKVAADQRRSHNFGDGLVTVF